MRGQRRLDVVAERQHVAAVAHGDAEPDRRLAVDAEHRLRRVGEAAPHLRDVAHADHPPAGDEVDVQDVLLGLEGAGDPQRDALVAGLDDAGGADLVLGLRAPPAAPARSMPRLASCCIENSTKITSSWAPMMSIFETSGTCSSSERTSST